MKHLRSTLAPFCNLPIAYIVAVAACFVLSRVLSTDAEAVMGLVFTTFVLATVACTIRQGKIKLRGLEGFLLPLFALFAYTYWASMLIGSVSQITTVSGAAVCVVIATFLIHSIVLLRKTSRILRSVETRGAQDATV